MSRLSCILFLFGVIAHPLSAFPKNEDLFLEAESFEDKGGWVLDQQFMDQMGSPYLLAHGAGKRVANARTAISVGRAGQWHVYVRTYNWTAPWTSAEGPGGFVVKVDSVVLKNVVGISGTCWEWQYAGVIPLTKGKHVLELSDLSGFDGRCDAIYLTRTKGKVPPSEVNGLEKFRRQVGALPECARKEDGYDLVVVGGGVAGMCAAVSAARNGCRVALVNDRPVLGGNNSSEVRVHLGGRIEIGRYPALGRMLREFGHSRKGNAQPAENYEDEKKMAFVKAEPGVTLYMPYRAVDVRKSADGMIASVVIRHVGTAEEIELISPLFADCTGDASVGYMAGADFMYGREAQSDFGESHAPQKADKVTLGTSVQWYSVETEAESVFPDFEYGLAFNDDNCEKVTMGEWTWETGMTLNQIDDFEKIRDYGLLVIYSNWSFLKNRSVVRDRYRNRELEWVAYIGGKRESRRLIGDYILHQDDLLKNVYHEDGTFTNSWSIDLHFPDPENTRHFPGAEFKAATIHHPSGSCAVPYRCLYSRNIDNLFMAGRNISVTHVALGSVRVMRTTAMMGEVVGMAASVCKKFGVKPRDVYRSHLSELKTLMEKGAAIDGELPDNQKFN